MAQFIINIESITDRAVPSSGSNNLPREQTSVTDTTGSAFNLSDYLSACLITSITLTFKANFGADKNTAKWEFVLQSSEDNGAHWSDVGFSDTQGGIGKTTKDYTFTKSYPSSISGLFGHSVKFRLNSWLSRDTNNVYLEKKANITNIKLTVTYTPRYYAYFFTHANVFMTVVPAEGGVSPTPPSYNKNTHYDAGNDFMGWKYKGKLYAVDKLPSLSSVTGAQSDVMVFDAVIAPQVYTVTGAAATIDGEELSVPSNLTIAQSGTYGYGDTVDVSYPANTDYEVDSGNEKYVFQYYTISCDGNALTDYSNLTDLDITEEISEEDDGMFADGRNVVVTAYFQRVYDFTVGLDDTKSSTNYESGLASISVTYTNSSEVAVSTTKTLAQLTNGLVSVRGYSTSFNVTFALNNTASTPDNYTINDIAPVGYTNSTVKTDSDNRFASYPLQHNITVTSSTASLKIELLKNYYALSIIYRGADTGDTPSDIVKVYKTESGDTTKLTAADLSYIPRGVDLLIEARDIDSGTRKTKYTADLSNASSGITLGNDVVVDGDTKYYTATLCPTHVTSSNVNSSITANLHQAFCNVRETVRTTNADTGATTDADPIDTSVRRTGTHTFSYTTRGTYRIGSASLSKSGASTPDVTWSVIDLNNGTLTYTYPASGSDGILDDMVFIVTYIPDITAYMYLTVGSCVYGNVDATSAVLRSQYATTKLAIAGVVEDASYEVSRIQYQWYVTNSSNVTSATSALFDIDITSWVRSTGSTSATNVFAPAQAVAIPYRNTASSDNLSALDANSYATCKIFVTFRKNIIYHSSRQNNTTTVERPSAVYYTPVGGTPQQVVAVFGQSRDCPYPVLLYGFEEQWVVIDNVTQTLFYSLDLLTGELSIFGTGDLTIGNTVPWINYIDFVRHVSIADTCTSIPAGLFANHPYLTDISLPTSLVNGSYPYADTEGERLVLYCLGTDNADNYTFEIDDERLVISYADGD